MKKTLQSIVIFGTLCSAILQASWEFRTPLSAHWRGYFHWQLSSVADAWWYDNLPSQKEHTAWDFHTWGVGYSRTASRAFWNCENHNTRDTRSLATLIFGTDAFRGEQAFTGGTFTTQTPANQALLVNNNPFLGFAFITPRFDYNEYGAFMGIEFSRNFGRDEKWHAGGRVSIPYKIIEIEQDNDYKLEETLADVVSVEQIQLGGELPASGEPTSFEYALRFDFLNVMNFSNVSAQTNATDVIPIVMYNDNGTVTIAGVDVSGDSPDTEAIGAYATKSNNGTLPAVPFRKLPSEVNGPLGPDGQAGNGTTSFFQTGVDYADNIRLDRNAQGTIFIVPRAVADPEFPGQTVITTDAENLYNTLAPLINTDLNPAELASEFFLNKGIDLAGYSRTVGIGDLFAEAYVGYGDKQNWFFDGLLGLQFPTAKRQKNSNDLYFKPTGNNGHVEIKLGIDTGWMPCDWFAFEFDLAYHHAFRRSEKRAATFTGATVTNLGPEITAKVSWNYFVGRVDLNFFHPHNPDLGMTFGYELFAKGHDKVKFDQATATDLLGRPNQPLDPEIYEKRTNALSNKLRAQVFNRWSYFEVFAGGSQVVSGRDVMRETEAHLGFVVYF